MTSEHSGSGDLNRSLELLWDGKEPATRGPKPGTTLNEIVDAAVALADRDGLSALSMRKVATELDVGTMTLYRYVPGKGELLDLMLDRVARLGEDAERQRGKDWRTTMEFVARGNWELFFEHPWLLQVNQSRPLLGPNALAGMEFALEGLDGLGLSGRDKISILMAVEHVVTGTARTYVLQNQVIADTGISDEEFWAAQVPILERVMGTGDYPQLAALDDDSFSIEATEAMEVALRAVLDGLEGFIAARSATAGPA
ncbi:TetR family transcriptional regulator [Allosaccharopolyspora coralli]|uniref:TetR family transcriptional regulator n=1 Tax=Allosaccharopolyspora coralli TaxID=2665642 RepID=A0A5Q3Q0R0_9PSEU|nr:TetR/AcrR family transcriptional regulator [Allosaccharopolyspora coralli]QGK68208.1 TetR family transcriptional regulator [Allosaccharopolyspora coralli]